MTKAAIIHSVHERPKRWRDDFDHSAPESIISETSTDERDSVSITHSSNAPVLPDSTIERYWVGGTEVIATQSKIKAHLTREIIER